MQGYTERAARDPLTSKRITRAHRMLKDKRKGRGAAPKLADTVEEDELWRASDTSRLTKCRPEFLELEPKQH